jgi:hypothetical protein
MSGSAPRCRFISSYDGVMRCADPTHAQGFCRFHYDAWRAGEISDEGHIKDHLSDQIRRRAINYHGISPPDVLVGEGSARS